jgi:adenosylmethionine---8-amino-7-oxononanoate aminotransferase
MNDFVILGTDTDAGKTTFALLWLAAFGGRFGYWKPLESGDSDTELVRRLVPAVEISPPLVRFTPPVAPLLAARVDGSSIPGAAEIAAARPARSNRHLLIETFGSPFSPLNETELQVELIRKLALPCVLVSSSAVGSIGRTLQCLRALDSFAIRPAVVALMGQPDEFAAEQISRHGRIPVVSMSPPGEWSTSGVAKAAQEQLAKLQALQSPSREPVQVPELLERDRDFIWHPYTSLREADPPLPVVAAQDEFLELADGRRVIDGISSWWTILHGHRHPVLLAAFSEAAARIDHVQFAGVTHPWAVELAELMLARAPWLGGRVFFSDNGSTAVEVALKMAYQFWCQRGEPKRTLFVGMEHGYHGDTFGAMAVGRDPLFFGRFEPLLFETKIVPLSAERLHETLAQHRGDVAAVIVEPLVQGAGGMHMHSPEKLRSLFEVARAHDVLFIADEVMTGCGRTGPLWAFQAAGIAPDLICTAKTLTGGMMPLAATLAAPKVVSAFDTSDRRDTFFHGHSFTAHPLACAVAVANWRMLPNGINPNAARIETFWQQSLSPLRDRPSVEDVRIRGSIAAIELTADGGYLAGIGRELRRHCLDTGVMLRPLGNVLYALPPLNTSDESLARIAAAIASAVAAVSS